MNIRALVIAAVLLAGTSFTARSQTFSITRSVFGTGMTPAQSGNIILDGTLGQAIIGPVSTSNIFIDQGFWYTLPISSSVQELPGVADNFSLGQNYPNPFNPSTTIKYSVGVRSKVTIRVMNLLGQEVHTPLVDQVQDPGQYEIDFTDADNLPSGTYIYRMDADNFSASKRMVLLK
ncbi:MAG TPA: T9SS type A sorting domain-containing protein [Candidatus Kapabacteria bacterium]|nr:T9SS type A sorting domain-containing protein [Candidatus Kapabacteria bacterium]